MTFSSYMIYLLIIVVSVYSAGFIWGHHKSFMLSKFHSLGNFTTDICRIRFKPLLNDLSWDMNERITFIICYFVDSMSVLFLCLGSASIKEN